MKILFVIRTSGMGGAERVSFNLAKWISDQEKWSASVIALQKSRKASYLTDGINYCELSGRNHIKGLRAFVKKAKPEVVITMSAPLCIYTVPALYGLGVKHIISERNSPAHFAGKKLTKYIYRLLMNWADGYVFQTKEAQAFYCNRIRSKSVVIHNPISNKSFDYHYQKNPKQTTIVSVGRLNVQKNQTLLIKAFSNIVNTFPNCSLIIWGEGSEKNRLINTAKDYGVKLFVKLPGTTNDIFDKLKEASLFVMSSNFEGMPNALMEAMALGLPCISTDCPCGGPRELIENGKNGILVPIGDVNALSSAISSVLANESFALSLGREASYIRESHSIDKIGEMWLSFIERLMVK